jgi:hypothetical protein
LEYFTSLVDADDADGEANDAESDRDPDGVESDLDESSKTCIDVVPPDRWSDPVEASCREDGWPKRNALTASTSPKALLTASTSPKALVEFPFSPLSPPRRSPKGASSSLAVVLEHTSMDQILESAGRLLDRT